jgi:hypothetical protein
MPGDLDRLRVDLQRLLDDSEPLQHAVGKFAKEEALDVAASDIGADLRFSGFARKVKLGAGYDTGNPVVLNLRPKGMWVLLDSGRKRSKPITPKRRRAAKSPPRAKAVRTPDGWRASSRSTPSRGHRTIKTLTKSIDRGVVRAAEKGLDDMTRKAFGR